MIALLTAALLAQAPVLSQFDDGVIIGRVCEDLGALNPRFVVPGHCTGWRAQHALARAFGEAFVPSCVGTRFEL